MCALETHTSEKSLKDVFFRLGKYLIFQSQTAAKERRETTVKQKHRMQIKETYLWIFFSTTACFFCVDLSASKLWPQTRGEQRLVTKFGSLLPALLFLEK